MIKLEIINNDQYSNYILRDSKGVLFDININFMNMKKPTIGSVLCMNKDLLEENVSLNFGRLTNNELKEDELIILEVDNKKIYLERFYG